MCRWLIDTGKDDEGMIVIADLHGGDLDDEKAKEEFREIRDVVAQEASLTLINFMCLMLYADLIG